MRAPNGTFLPGHVANPKGRKHGSKHKATVSAQALLDGDAEALTRKCIDSALDGDMVAMRLCLERLLPPKRDRHLSLRLPAIETTADMVKASGAILQSVCSGALTPLEAESLARLLEVHRRVVDLVDIDARLAKIEAQDGKL